VRSAVGAQRDGLGVGDHRGDRQREGRIHHLGQPRSDVVEAAGVDGHGVPGAVDLHPRAVELGLEDGRPTKLFECVLDPRRGLREHGTDGPPDL
jgi:hypothetical protein